LELYTDNANTNAEDKYYTKMQSLTLSTKTLKFIARDLYNTPIYSTHRGHISELLPEWSHLIVPSACSYSGSATL